MGTEAHWIESNGKSVDENTGKDEAAFAAIPTSVVIPAEPNGGTVDGTYGAAEAAVITNLVARVAALEDALIDSGIMAAAYVPLAPTALAGTAGDTQVVLTWTAPENTGNWAITDYDIDWSDDGGATWLGPVAKGAGTTGYTKTTLVNDTAYTFRVRAVNSVGDGAWSDLAGPYTPVAP